MNAGIEVHDFAYSDQFKAELIAAPPDVQRAARSALELLRQNPRSKSLRLHHLSGFPKPTLWKIDVFANHSWQITFELIDTVAHLKRIATHKIIDRRPR